MKEYVVKALHTTGLSRDELYRLIEIPKERERGDFAFPCFVLAKHFKKKPDVIAQDLVKKIQKNDAIERVVSVGPYLNFFMNHKKFALLTLAEIEKKKEKYGIGTDGKGKKFMIEFSQPNTHKAFHVGHIRGTSLGESIARLREMQGYRVIRANYSGDTGMHIAKWIWAYLTFHKGEPLQSEESWFARIYVEAVQKLEGNEQGQREVEEINRKLDARSDKHLMKLWKDTRTRSIGAWKAIYSDLDVEFDVHFFESEVEKEGKRIVQELVKKGIAVESEGARIMDLKEYGLGVWVLLRKDGTVLYSAKDLALGAAKFKQYKLNESLVITSVEQNLHFQQLRKTLELMHFPRWKEYLHLGYESIRLPEGKMSSRTGTNILYADFRDELVAEAKREIATRATLNEKELNKRALAIGIAAMKYTMLKQDIRKIIVFNKEEAVRFEGDTGPYLLYSYARAQSILRRVQTTTRSSAILSIADSERVLLNELARFPDVIAAASRSLEPAAVAHYAYELAQQFNEFYHACPVIGSLEQAFRLRLVKSFSQVLKNALYVLGIPVLEEM